MNVHFEPTSGNIRLFIEGDFGDPYDWSCRVDFVDNVAHLSLVEDMSPGVRYALLKWGEDNHISEFRWVRFKNGQKKTIRHPVLSN